MKRQIRTGKYETVEVREITRIIDGKEVKRKRVLMSEIVIDEPKTGKITLKKNAKPKKEPSTFIPLF
jgi:hypothetical protein